MLTVMSWLWTQPGGRAKYTAHHANIWADMVRRNLSMDHEIALVTDITEGLDRSIRVIEPPRDFEEVRIPTWGEKLPQCLRRLAMFRPDAADIFGARFVNMDLDCVVTGSLDPLFDRDDDFIMYRGTSQTRPYNGSMMLMTAGARSQVYTDFTPEGAAEAGQRFVGSDQAWISHRLGPGEATWGPEHGVYWWKQMRNVREPRLVFFPGNLKPWTIAETDADKWVVENYRRSLGGRCLILGYADTVWTDAEAAIETGPFDAVIASPEAAEHWPSDILAIARDDLHAERLAHMHGFDEIVFCGRSEREAT